MDDDDDLHLHLLSEDGYHLVVELALLLHHEGVHAAGEVDRLEAVGPEKKNFVLFRFFNSDILKNGQSRRVLDLFLCTDMKQLCKNLRDKLKFAGKTWSN